MAKRVVETLLSDLSGAEIPADSAGGTVEFSVSGQQYAVDLTADELDAFNGALEPYVSAAQRLSKRGAPVRSSRLSASGSGRRSREQLSAIRVWARKNGFEVADRGRISAELQEAFDAAH